MSNVKPMRKDQGAATSETVIEGVRINTEMLDSIREVRDELQKCADDRKHANEYASELRARLVTAGLSKEAVKHAMKYLELNDNERAKYDISMALVRRALGAPMQIDWITQVTNAA